MRPGTCQCLCNVFRTGEKDQHASLSLCACPEHVSFLSSLLFGKSDTARAGLRAPSPPSLRCHALLLPPDQAITLGPLYFLSSSTVDYQLTLSLSGASARFLQASAGQLAPRRQPLYPVQHAPGQSENSLSRSQVHIESPASRADERCAIFFEYGQAVSRLVPLEKFGPWGARNVPPGASMLSSYRTRLWLEGAAVGCITVAEGGGGRRIGWMEGSSSRGDDDNLRKRRRSAGR